MKAADAGGGVLLIVKNYTGDLLNFRLAAELAEDEGIGHTMVVVAEDASLPADGSGPGRRGTAATLLVEKIAGAAAARGAGLEDTAALAQRVADSSRSIGFALNSCITPMAGRATFDLAETEIEFGVGIHGERGRRNQALKASADQAEELVDLLVTELDLAPATPVLAFTNGLGSTPVSEQFILHNDVVAALERRGLQPVRHLVGSYVTSLDMAGASLSLLPLDEQLVDLWDAPVRTPALTW
jgi:dihydroxyacetone kinase-like protein